MILTGVGLQRPSPEVSLDGNNPGHAKRVALIESPLATGQTLQTEVFPLYSFDRIGGTLHCNKAVTVTAYQGPSSDSPKYLDVGEGVNHPGNADIGQGTALNYEIFCAEGYGQVRIRNTSGETATIRLSVELRRKA